MRCPVGGLTPPITLKPYPGATEATLPEVHTCTRDMHVAPWRCKLVVAERLHMALEFGGDGFNKE